jgi:hypothetical protein
MELIVSVPAARAADGAADPAAFAEAELDFSHPEPTRTPQKTRNIAPRQETNVLRIAQTAVMPAAKLDF